MKKGEEMEQNGSVENVHADVKQIEEMMDMDQEKCLKLKEKENQDKGERNTVAVRVVDSSTFMKLKSELFGAAR